MANKIDVIWEMKILCDTHVKVQTTVNQWKHKYKVNILNSVPLNATHTHMTLCRIERTKLTKS